ncbi:MAG: hypothetical protein ABMA13_09380 [Chthoniobacteraceae bacterium]
MKALLLLLIISAALLAGCESDMPPVQNRENPIQRGLRGEGTLKPLDYSDDPFVRDAGRGN